jgi:hypothetical protein
MKSLALIKVQAIDSRCVLTVFAVQVPSLQSLLSHLQLEALNKWLKFRSQMKAVMHDSHGKLPKMQAAQLKVTLLKYSGRMVHSTLSMTAIKDLIHYLALFHGLASDKHLITFQMVIALKSKLLLAMQMAVVILLPCLWLALH